jgi:hypothetical protein
MRRILAVLCLALGLAGPGTAQDTPQTAQPPPTLREFRLEGATVYKSDDVLWLLQLREGSPLTGDAAAIAKRLEDLYHRDGYAKARVTGSLDSGRLTLTADEGRIDEIEILGIGPDEIARMRRLLGIQPGDIYNTRVIDRATTRLEQTSGGAIVVGRPRKSQQNRGIDEASPDDIDLERRGSRNVLVVPLRYRTSRTSTSLGSGREDLFSPADGVSPALGVAATIYDPHRFNHAYINGYVSYKFGRDDPGYSFGAERPLFGSAARLFLGGEAHDMTASDDLWRISSLEQSLVAVGFKNSFRDYYRRHGAQVFGVLRTGDNNEFSVAARWDRHQPLLNSTDFSFFRDDADFRPALAVADQQVNAWVIGYTFDTRPLTGAGEASTYARHLRDNLYGTTAKPVPGLRLDWTSEIAGRGLGGDAKYDRHIFNLRGYLPLSSHTVLSGRTLFGFSGGTLPAERVFALGGIGSVHGYTFKEVSGTKMALLNAEYRVNIGAPIHNANRDAFNLFAFYDAGKLAGGAQPSDWLNGVGGGFGFGGLRVEFGFRADAIPKSRQILVRFSPTF